MRLVYYLLLIALLGCQPNDPSSIGPEQTEDAFITDTSRFADGCELYIQFDTGIPANQATQYKPTAATLSIAQRAITKLAPDPKNPIRIPVRIRFIETTNRVVIQCGWVSPTVTEIKILEISQR